MPIDPASQLIDPAWLSANAAAFGGSSTGPWMLGKAFPGYSVPISTATPGAVPYALAADVRATGTAFVYAAPKVILDLDGHTITYNDADPIAVPGGDFSAWPGSWDASGAGQSTFSLVDSAPFSMPDAQSLRWIIAAAAGPQSIVSAPIALPDLRSYTASVCSCSGANGQYFGVQVEVVDADTGVHVARWRRFIGNLNNAEGGQVTFLPDRAGQSVRLKITPTTVPAKPLTTAIIGRAVVTRSLDYGVLATKGDPTVLSGCGFTSALADPTFKVNGGANLPRPILLAYQAGGASPTLRCSQGTGRIVQGRAAGAYCHPALFAYTTGPVSVEGVSCEVLGDDTSGIVAVGSNTVPAPGDVRVIRSNRVSYPAAGAHITTRQALVAAINCTGGGPLTIEGNTVDGNPQIGIKVGTAVPGAVTLIEDNVLDPNTTITNGYVLYLAGKNIRVTGNRVVTSRSSRGLILDYSSADVEIDHNTIDVCEGPNREYLQGAGCRALAIRNEYPPMNARILVHDNEFTSRTRAGKQFMTMGARFNLANDGTADGTGAILRDNLFRAIVEGATDPGSQYQGVGVMMDVCLAGVRPRFEGNRVEATDIGVQLAGPNSNTVSPVAEVEFSATTIARPTEGLTSRAHVSWQFGFVRQPVTATLLGTAYENGATPAIKWGGTGAMDVGVGWTLTVQARDLQRAAVPGAVIVLADVTGSTVSDSTGPDGNRDIPVVVTRYARPDGANVTPSAATKAPHQLTVSRSDLPDTFRRSFTLTADTTFVALLGGDGGGPIPPVDPPPDPPPPPPPPPIELGVKRLIVTSGSSFTVFTNF